MSALTSTTRTPLADVDTGARSLLWSMNDMSLTDTLAELRIADTGVLRRMLAACDLRGADDESRASLVIRCVGLWADVTLYSTQAYTNGWDSACPSPMPPAPLGWDYV